MNHLLLIGTDFRHSSLKMREGIYFDDHLIPIITSKIIAINGVSECIILTTCNRVEIYMICRDPDRSARSLVRFLGQFHGIPVEELDRMLYIHRCREAALHLLRVASGLESMVIGEGQILGQVRLAYHQAKRTGGTGPYLSRLFQTAFALGKQVRRNTVISSGVTSIASAAAGLAMEKCDPASTRYGILGCGEMGRIVARHMSRHGVAHIAVTNRSVKPAERLANDIGCDIYPFDRLEEMIEESDCLITATASRDYLLTWPGHSKTLTTKAHYTMIDIAIPRDVDPRLGSLPNVSLYSIDDLQEMIDRNIDLRRSSIERIMALIEQKLGLYEAWYQHRHEDERDNQNRNPGIGAGAGTDPHCPGPAEGHWHHERPDY